MSTTFKKLAFSVTDVHEGMDDMSAVEKEFNRVNQNKVKVKQTGSGGVVIEEVFIPTPPPCLPIKSKHEQGSLADGRSSKGPSCERCHDTYFLRGNKVHPLPESDPILRSE